MSAATGGCGAATAARQHRLGTTTTVGIHADFRHKPAGWKTEVISADANPLYRLAMTLACGYLGIRWSASPK
jgi:hypothetical protein